MTYPFCQKLMLVVRLSWISIHHLQAPLFLLHLSIFSLYRFHLSFRSSGSLNIFLLCWNRHNGVWRERLMYVTHHFPLSFTVTARPWHKFTKRKISSLKLEPGKPCIWRSKASHLQLQRKPEGFTVNIWFCMQNCWQTGLLLIDGFIITF